MFVYLLCCVNAPLMTTEVALTVRDVDAKLQTAPFKTHSFFRRVIISCLLLKR